MRGPRQLTMQKTIVVNDGRLSQGDDWVWYGCLRDSWLRCPAVGLTLPVFASGMQIERCEPRLMCNGQGRPVSYEFRLRVNESLAFVTRSLSTTQEHAPAYVPPDAV